MNRNLQKTSLIALMIALMSTIGFGQSVIYVNASAAGAGDGTSWDDAYTDLQAAIDAAASGDQVWVAAGTYTPGAVEASFLGKSGVELYGGFEGTETMLAERDPATNTTTLSGDNNGDDTEGEFDMNRSDNSRSVVFVDTSVTTAFVIDGFTVSGGNALFFTDSTEIARQSFGGGIQSLGVVVVNDCILSDNSAGRGGAIAIYGGTGSVGSQVTNSTIEFNRAGAGGGVFVFSAVVFSNDVIAENRTDTFNQSSDQGGGVYSEGSRNTYTNVEFIDNSAFRGGAVYQFSSSETYENCTFDRNQAGFDGSILYHAESTGFTSTTNISNCTFEDNVASRIGGIAVLGGDNRFNINDCSFNRNTAGLVAGAIFGSFTLPTTVFDISNTTFTENESGRGGAMWLQTEDSLIMENCEFSNNLANAGHSGAFFALECFLDVNNCRFENNESIGGTGQPSSAVSLLANTGGSIQNSEFRGNESGFGGVLGVQGELREVFVRNCEFSNNNATTSGGVASVTFGGQITFDSCNFENNTADQLGGAIYMQEDTTSVTLLNSRFVSNTTSTSGGGALGINNVDRGVNDEVFVTIDNCYFEANQSAITDQTTPASSGGALALTGYDSDKMAFNVSNSTFLANSAGYQGGAITVTTGNALLQNNLFLFNNCTEEGYGAIMQNGGPNNPMLYLVNNTFAYNNGTLSSGFAQFTSVTDSTDDRGTAVLLNNLFLLPNTDEDANEAMYAAEAGNPTIVSLGGNFFSDNTLDTAAVATDMLGLGTQEDPFVDAFGLDLNIAEGASVINGGVSTGELVPETDFAGNARRIETDTCVTPGAYEFYTEGGACDPTSSTVSLEPTQQISLTPTITNDIINVELESDYQGEVRVLIFDYTGKLVMDRAEEKSGQLFRRSYNVGTLNDGAYILRTVTENGVGGNKFIIAH